MDLANHLTLVDACFLTDVGGISVKRLTNIPLIDQVVKGLCESCIDAGVTSMLPSLSFSSLPAAIRWAAETFFSLQNVLGATAIRG